MKSAHLKQMLPVLNKRDWLAGKTKLTGRTGKIIWKDRQDCWQDRQEWLAEEARLACRAGKTD
jgi:hypothetical protein